MNFLIIFLVINFLLFDIINPFKLNQFKSSFRNKFKNNYQKNIQIKTSRINNKFLKYKSNELEPRILLDFITDPSVFVTMLNQLEQMYLAFPFPLAIILKPFINFFRIPNRRRRRSLILFKNIRQ